MALGKGGENIDFFKLVFLVIKQFILVCVCMCVFMCTWISMYTYTGVSTIVQVCLYCPARPWLSLAILGLQVCTSMSGFFSGHWRTIVFTLTHKPSMMHLPRKNHDLQLVVFILTLFSFTLLCLCPLALCLPREDQICLFSQFPFFLQVMGVLLQSLLPLQSLPFSWALFQFHDIPPHIYTYTQMEF